MSWKSFKKTEKKNNGKKNLKCDLFLNLGRGQ